MNEQLSQDEIDTLLSGVDSGDVDTEVDKLADANEAIPYDFSAHNSFVGGRIPALDIVNERFTSAMQNSLFKMLRRNATVKLNAVKMVKYAEYQQGLSKPGSCNLINVKPLQGTGMIVIEPRLVYVTVDNFFGGDGRYLSVVENREFTPTEKRVVQLLLDMSFIDLKQAWEPVMKMDFSLINSEANPGFAKIVEPSEIVVVSTFSLELDGGGGEFHVVLPYKMIEPILDILETGSGSEKKEVNQDWVQALKKELKQAPVSIECSMAHTRLTLGDVLDLNPGDIIPVELSELITVRAENTPVFRAALGVSNGKNALRYVEPIRPTDYS